MQIPNAQTNPKNLFRANAHHNNSIILPRCKITVQSPNFENYQLVLKLSQLNIFGLNSQNIILVIIDSQNIQINPQIYIELYYSP